MSYSGQLVVGSNGYGINFPNASPRLQWSIAVTALPSNSADVFVGPSAVVMAPMLNPATGQPMGGLPTPPGIRLPPGRTVTIPVSDPTAYWLSAAVGDGVTFSGT